MGSFVAPITLREAALRQLRDEIVSGQLQPGTVVKDSEIAARFGMSITPVREAIGQLTAEGLIDFAPNRSRRITAVTQKNALELIDVMALLACAGVDLAVHNLTEEHMATLRGRLRQFEQALASDDVATAGAVGADFSTVLISASGNRELQIHIDLVVARTMRLAALRSHREIWSIWMRGYGEVLEHLESGDTKLAVLRHAQIYSEFRSMLETMPFA